MIATPTKRCRKCDEVKPLKMFSPKGGGYLSGSCKPCRARAHREARAAGDIRNILSSMVQRCHNPKHPRYPLYGARGIAVCDRWRNDTSAFLHDMGPRPSPKHSVDRADGGGNYEPSNCRWATQKQQMRNTNHNAYIDAFGERLTIAEWSERKGIGQKLVWQRIRVLGWHPEMALTTPPQQRRAS